MLFMLPAVPAAAQQAVLAAEPVQAVQTAALHVLLIFTALFLVLSLATLAALALLVRRSFWQQAATGTDTAWRMYLMHLPLGAPAGTVRALISLYVVVFGLLVLVMQNRLGLTNVEAITGFIGVVITFYFTSRGHEQAQRPAAPPPAPPSAGPAQDAHSTTDPSVPTAAPVDPAQAGPAGKLRDLRDDVQLARQTIGALKTLNVGTGLLDQADSLAGDADTALKAIEPLLDGKADPAGIAAALAQGQPLLDRLNGAGLPGILGEAAGAIGPAMKLLGPALGGISGGPLGIVGGLVMGGVQLLADQQKFAAWKAALLASPFDRALLPPVVDGNAAQLALQAAPGMAQHLAGAPPALATEMLRAALEQGPDGAPKPAAEVAAELLARSDLGDLPARFASADELAAALQEYRAGSVFAEASRQLAGKIDIPASATGGAPASIDLPTLMRAALGLRADPGAAAALDRVAGVVQALGALHLGPDKLTALAQSGLQLAATLAGGRQAGETR
jgi:hypothetical protein